MRGEDKQDVSPNEQTRSCRALCNTVLETSNSSTCVRGKSVRILIKQAIRGVLSPESCVGAGEVYINARPHNKVYKCLSTQLRTELRGNTQEGRDVGCFGAASRFHLGLPG